MVVITRTRPNGEVFSFYVDGKLHEILLGFRKAMYKKNTSGVIIIDGKSGFGKTTLGNQVSITLDENYGLKKIFYNPDSFLAGLAEAKQGDTLMFDEAMLISNRSTMSAINKMVIQAMSMIRSKRICIIFCVNSIFDLDKNLVLSRANLLLHVYGDSLFDRGKYAVFFKPRGQQDKIKQLYLLGKKFYDYSRPKANFISKFSSEFVVDEEEYEKQKQIGVNAFLNVKVGSQTTKFFEGRNNAIRELHKEGQSVERIATLFSLDKKTIYKILSIKKELNELA